MQYSVDYAITIVFICILISITGTEREKLEHTLIITIIRHLVALHKYYYNRDNILDT